jgi:hypothetical protein
MKFRQVLNATLNELDSTAGQLPRNVLEVILLICDIAAEGIALDILFWQPHSSQSITVKNLEIVHDVTPAGDLQRFVLLIQLMDGDHLNTGLSSSFFLVLFFEMLESNLTPTIDIFVRSTYTTQN